MGSGEWVDNSGLDPSIFWNQSNTGFKEKPIYKRNAIKKILINNENLLDKLEILYAFWQANIGSRDFVIFEDTVKLQIWNWVIEKNPLLYQITILYITFAIISVFSQPSIMQWLWFWLESGLLGQSYDWIFPKLVLNS